MRVTFKTSPSVWWLEAALCGFLAVVQVVAALVIPNTVVGLPIAAAWLLLTAFFLTLGRLAKARRKPYWVEDESLSREETLRRFYALKPELTVGPMTQTPGTTVTRIFPAPSVGGEAGTDD